MKTRQYRFGVEIEVVINRDNKVECMTQLEALEAVNVTTDGSIQYDDGGDYSPDVTVIFGAYLYKHIKREYDIYKEILDDIKKDSK